MASECPRVHVGGRAARRAGYVRGMARPLPLVAATLGLGALACSSLPGIVTCGPGTTEFEKQCIPAYPQVSCGPGTGLSGTTCIVTPEASLVPDQERIMGDLHGRQVQAPPNPTGLSAWTFSFPTEFHQVVIEKTTEVGDVLQLDTRLQMEDFNNHHRYTFWLTLVYKRQQGLWNVESATLAHVAPGWLTEVPAIPPEGAEVTTPTEGARPLDARPARAPGRPRPQPIRGQ